MPIPDFPDVTDDSGLGTDGTLFNDHYNTLLHDAIEAIVFGVTNPSVSAATIIDEVVAARGSKSSLDARIDVEHNEDGTHKTSAGAVSKSVLALQLREKNLFRNADLQHWSAGGSAAPDEFELLGAGATVRRTGVGEIDTTTFGAGNYAVKVTRAGADCSLGQDIIATADMPANADLKSGVRISAMVLCKTDTANFARIIISDGVTEDVSDFHTGGNTREVLTVTHVIDSAATKISIRGQGLTSNASAYFGGWTAVIGTIAPTSWMPYTSYDERRFSSPVVFADSMSIGNVGAGETTLKVFKLTPNLMFREGRRLRLTAWGETAANANNKTIRVWISAGAKLVVVNGAHSGLDWKVVLTVLNGTTGNSSPVLAEGHVNGVAEFLNSADQGLDMAAAWDISISGQGTANDDILLKGMTVEID